MADRESTTLMIRHFPNEVLREDKVSFMKHFGAIEIKCLEAKHKKNSLIFARFENRMVAEAVLHKLHQTELFGQLLSVEFVRNYDPLKNLEEEKTRQEEASEEKSTESKLYENFLNRLNSWTGQLNLDQPPPVHLKYQYPPPSRVTLANIAKALAKVPKFYTQVLHLMNRMNLPCPFVDSEDYPLVSEVWEPPRCEVGTDTRGLEGGGTGGVEEEESELESEGEAEAAAAAAAVVPRRPAKRARGVRAVAQGRTATLLTAPLTAREVFEEAPKAAVAARKIELKLTSAPVRLRRPSLPHPEPTQEGFLIMEPTVKQLQENTEIPEEELDDPSTIAVISDQQLASNRISTRDQHLLPVFKNYQPGLPSCRLYIKNLAKTVIARDLHYIYRRYLIKDIEEEQGTMFDIRLMQEGRMKGQAFVSLQNVRQAELALNQTNGYILKGKPMVVHFARSSKQK